MPQAPVATAHPGRVRSIVIKSPRPIIVTIDGPAGTGKSTVARLLAHGLGIDFLDTGAMYRAAAAIALDKRIPLDDHAAIVREVASADLHFNWSEDPPTILAWGNPIDERIRTPDVNRTVSRIAAIPDLRRHMVAKQRIIGNQHPRLVTEGRDQGSVVFPAAAVRFYLHARPEVRARRRLEQIARDQAPSGPASTITDEAVARMCDEIVDRDRSDSTRADGPLIIPQGAEIVDTSDMTLEQVVEHLEAIVMRRIGEA